MEISISQTIKNLSLTAINMNPHKTFYFPEGYGECTSWYQDSGFVSQYGVETSLIVCPRMTDDSCQMCLVAQQI